MITKNILHIYLIYSSSKTSRRCIDASIHQSSHLKNKSSGIKFIKIPLDATLPWNSIPSTLPSDQWCRIDNREEIEKVFTSRNKAHLSQPEGIPFTIVPLKDMIGPDNFTPFGNAIFTDTEDSETLLLSKIRNIYFNN